MKSPENKGAPNASETAPRRQVSDHTKHALGSLATKNSTGNKK